MQPTDDIVTLTLTALAVLLIGIPGLVFIAWRVTRPPFAGPPFRWLYLAWACMLISSSVWKFSRDAAVSVDEAGADTAVRFAFLSLGMLVIVFIGARYRFAFLRELTTGVLGIFSLFALWGLASTLWSEAPTVTFYKSVEYCAMLALFALAAWLINSNTRDPQSRSLALKSIFDFSWFLVFFLMVNVYVGAVVWPEYAILQNYRDQSGLLGFSLQGALPGIAENGVGQIAAVLGIVALVRILLMPRFRALYVPIFAFSVITMVLTQSRSPILGFVLAVGVVLLVGRRFVLLAASGVFMGVAMLTQYSQLAYEFLRRGQSTQDLASLTGRVGYWQSSLEAVRERLLQGYGANAGGRYVIRSVSGETDVSTVHNLWLEVLLDTGAVGLVLFLAGVAATWYWMVRIRAYATKTPIGRLLWLESLGVLTVLCVRSIFSVPLVWSWNVVLTFGVVLIFVSVMRSNLVQESHSRAATAQPVPAARRRRPSIRR